MISRLSPTALLTILLGLASLPATAQQDEPSVDKAFFERVAVDIVNVEVYVTDKEGNPVGGLERDDFIVTEDGKPVEVVNFYRVAAGAPAPESEPAQEPEPVQEPTAPTAKAPLPTLPLQEPVVPESQRLHLVIYVDNFNIKPLDRNRVFGRLRQFLQDTVRRGDRVMVASYDRSLHIRQPFTSDPILVNRVLLDLETFSGSAVERESERASAMKEIFETDSVQRARITAERFAENQYQEVNYTLDALREMLDSLGGLPGRKMMIHLSDGIPMVPGQDLYQAIQQRFADVTALGEAFTRDLSRRWLEVIAQANSNRVSFYTIDTGGLRTRSGMGAENTAMNTFRPTSFMAVDGTRASNLQGTLRMMASRTGGQVILNTNDVTAGLERVARDFGNYYSLGYRAPTIARGRYHKIEVRLRDEVKGWKLRHREGYRDKSISVQIEDSTRAYLIHGYETNPLGVSLDFGVQSLGDDGMTRVPMRVRIPMDRVTLLRRGDLFEGQLTLYFGAADESGRNAPLQEMPLVLRIPASSIDVARSDEVARVIDATMRPGTQRLVIAVRDEIGDERSVVGRYVQVAEF